MTMPDIQVYDVWAEWCPPCKKFSPIFDKVAKEFPYVEFKKINADENADFLNEFGIRSIPMILIVKNGNVVYEHAGILSDIALEAAVTSMTGYSSKHIQAIY